MLVGREDGSRPPSDIPTRIGEPDVRRFAWAHAAATADVFGGCNDPDCDVTRAGMEDDGRSFVVEGTRSTGSATCGCWRL